MKRQLTRHDFLIAGSIGLAGTLGLAGCGSETPSTTEPDAPEGTSTVTETDVVTINGLYVNDGYVNEDNDQLMLLYLLYTVHPAEENLEISSNITTLTINDKNDYSSERRAGACKYMGSYYYSDFIEDVYMGTELKVAETFEIPAADLEAGAPALDRCHHPLRIRRTNCPRSGPGRLCRGSAPARASGRIHNRRRAKCHQWLLLELHHKQYLLPD